MEHLFLVLIITIAALAFMMLGLALTRMIKGKDLQTEVGENDEMKKRGLTCASDQFRREEAELRGGDCGDFISCGTGGCGTCTEHDEKTV